MRFWIGHGVRIFRVDNPHTKAFPFWEWLIAEIRREYPDVVMLAEAFVRPAVMQRLAKIGFSQSYTYFTWRNTAWELSQYLTELSQTELVDWFRPNFWVNTPDILHATLQYGGPPAFKMRAALAAITCPSWGMYSGYELCENAAVREGSEEYLDSEKYQLRPRDWSQPRIDRTVHHAAQRDPQQPPRRDRAAEHPSPAPHDRRLDALRLAVHARQGRCDHPHRQPGSPSSHEAEHMAGSRRARR